MALFLFGLFLGALAGMMIIVIVIAGKKEGEMKERCLNGLDS